MQSTNIGPTATTINIGGDGRELKRGGECENEQSRLLHGDLKTLQLRKLESRSGQFSILLSTELTGM